MIKSLSINNIALIDHLDIDFKEGLTVLSGETGSGKSIIIDSLAFVLGDRADKTLIKYGADNAEVTALFEVSKDNPVVAKLEEYGYGGDTEILLNRRMSVAGKNEIRIQGKTATLAILKEICAELVDIFGQGQHLSLLNEKNQLSVLDAFCNFNGDDVLLKDELCSQLSAINKELKSLGGSDAERARTLDILKYQIDEITAAKLDVGEEENLSAMHLRIVNEEKIVSALELSTVNLNGEQGAISKIAESCSALKGISSLEHSVIDLQNRLQSARLEIEDVNANLCELIEQTEYNQVNADRLESRLEEIKQIKRKYGGSVEECLKFLDNAKTLYDSLSNSAEHIDKLNAEKKAVLEKMYSVAKRF